MHEQRKRESTVNTGKDPREKIKRGGGESRQKQN